MQEPEGTRKSKMVFPFHLGGMKQCLCMARGLIFYGSGFLNASLPASDVSFSLLQMNMLMKLQEAANYSGTQSGDSDSTSHHEDNLDSALESTL